MVDNEPNGIQIQHTLFRNALLMLVLLFTDCQGQKSVQEYWFWWCQLCRNSNTCFMHVQNIKIPTIVVSSIHLSIHIFIFSTWVSFDSEDINYWNRQQPLASSSLRTPHCRRGDLLLLREVFLSGGGAAYLFMIIHTFPVIWLTHWHINTIWPLPLTLPHFHT